MAYDIIAIVLSVAALTATAYLAVQQQAEQR
jgi:hypothetical protein